MSPFSGDNVTWAFNFVKCSPSKGIVHSGRCRKLCPIYAFFFLPQLRTSEVENGVCPCRNALG